MKMKFVKWDGETAYFKKATPMERFKSWVYWTIYRNPDPKNLVVEFEHMDLVTKMANEKRLKKP